MRRFRLKQLLPIVAMLLCLISLAGSVHAQQAAVSGSASDQVSGAAEKPTDSGAQEKDENDAYLQSKSVKAIGAKLGMSPERAATAFQVANFSVLALLIVWFLAKALPKAFRDRGEAIQKHLLDARTATQEASARLSGVEERLGKLDGQIAAMRAQAEKDSALDEARIKASVEDEKRKILAAAEQEIQAATTQAQRQIQKYAAELAIEQAARKLVVSAETDRLLVQDFARRLTGDESKGGHN